MSLIPETSAQYASFGRILGIYRFLLHAPDQREQRNRLEKLLSPPCLVHAYSQATEPGPLAFQGTLTEAIKMGLVKAEGEDLCLHPELSPDARDPGLGESVLVQELARLLFNEKNTENHPIAQLIAWCLAQDPAKGFSGHQDFERQLIAQGGEEHLYHNDTSYTHGTNWACDLGLAWRFAIPKKNNSAAIIPDPTAFLRRVLPLLLPKPEVETPFGVVLEKLAIRYPIFEGGMHREAIEAWSGKRPERHLSRSSAMAWLRLHQAGVIQLLMPADAEAWLFPDGDQIKRFSHVARRA